MDKRYERNIPSISEEEQKLLSHKKVLVIGCGGLGGYIIEYLARLGVGHITAIDGDSFEPNNLNRQLNSSPDVLGYSKALTAAMRVKKIAPDTEIIPIETFFDTKNADELVKNQDLVIDALDNIPSRFIMEDACERQKITFVHGAILGWNFQVTVGRPGSRILHHIYKTATNISCKTSLAMTPPACAAVEIAEALKILTGHEPSLEGKLLMYNLQNMEQLIISIN